MMYRLTSRDIIQEFRRLKNDNKTLRIRNVTFIAENDWLFKPTNYKYANAEIQWYLTQDLNVNRLLQFYPAVPKIWQNISDEKGYINSNYGWAVFSQANGNQFQNAMSALMSDKNSRHGICIYNRPSMHQEAGKDFMCCQNNIFSIQDDVLEMHVHMRSFDAVFGYNNDVYWFNWLFNKAYNILSRRYLNLEKGDLVITASDIHVYDIHREYV